MCNRANNTILVFGTIDWETLNMLPDSGSTVIAIPINKKYMSRDILNSKIQVYSLTSCLNVGIIDHLMQHNISIVNIILSSTLNHYDFLQLNMFIKCIVHILNKMESLAITQLYTVANQETKPIVTMFYSENCILLSKESENQSLAVTIITTLMQNYTMFSRFE